MAIGAEPRPGHLVSCVSWAGGYAAAPLRFLRINATRGGVEKPTGAVKAISNPLVSLAVALDQQWLSCYKFRTEVSFTKLP